MTLTRAELIELKEKLDKITLSGKGRFYIHIFLPEILNLSAENIYIDYKDFVVTDKIKHNPHEYILISHGTELYKVTKYDHIRGKFIETTEKHVNILSPEDYNMFFEFFKTLKD